MHRKVILLLAALIMAVSLSACSQTADETGAEIKTAEPVKVIVSILPQADFVKSIGGDQVSVAVLIPPGANPEDYEMSPRQIQEISNADIYIAVGNIPFEKISLERIKSANPDMPIINSPEDEGESEHDPHVWLSPRLVKEQAQIIYAALSRIDAAHEALYAENKKAFVAELDQLDAEIEELLADRQRDYFLVYHPAWGYFAADYGLIEIAIEKDGKEPTAYEMAQIIERANSEGIKAVLASPQHSTRSAETVAKQLDGELKIIDSLPADYIAGLREAAAIFKEVLND